MATPQTKPFPAFHLGDRIRKAREEAGFEHIKDLAETIGIDRGSLAKYERSGIEPRRPVLIAIANATGFSVEQLRGHDDNDPDPIVDLTRPDQGGRSSIRERGHLRPVDGRNLGRTNHRAPVPQAA